MNEAAEPENRTTLGRYTLLQEIARGGMGTVHRAQLHSALGFSRWVAVKTIHPHLAKDERFVAMFLDEARVVSRIHHPNVCSVVDFGSQDGTPFLVMEYLSGETLGTIIKAIHGSRTRPYWLIARIIADAARGLHAAHESVDAQGRALDVVHRDISPQNIFVLNEGLTKVLDFGIARARGRLEVSNAGEIKGKLAYMAPEQFQGRQVDRRCDIWALGVVLWEAIVGKRLFYDQNEGATITAVLQTPITAPITLARDCPAALSELTMRMLTRDTAMRIATAAMVADALEDALHDLGEPASTSRVSKWMSTQLSDREERRRNLEPGDASQITTSVQERPTPDDVSRVSATTKTPETHRPDGEDKTRRPATAPRQRFTRARFIVGGMALLATIGGVGYWSNAAIETEIAEGDAQRLEFDRQSPTSNRAGTTDSIHPRRTTTAQDDRTAADHEAGHPGPSGRGTQPPLEEVSNDATRMNTDPQTADRAVPTHALPAAELLRRHAKHHPGVAR